MTEGDDIPQQLRRLAGTRNKVRMTRGIGDEGFHNGFVVGVGQRWVLFAPFHDFYAEGFEVVRLEDITALRSGEYERHWDRMLQHEGALDHLGSPPEVPLDDIGQLLRALKQAGHNVIVECEDQEEEDFFIGEILDVGDRMLKFANFGGLGNWDEQPDDIPLTEVTRVQIGTPYVRTFSKYLEGPCPHSGHCP